MKAVAMREVILLQMIELAYAAKPKERFIQDRAVGLVNGSLLAMDQEFSELGFGAWMPFRFPDQWLAFCALLQRILAANGLIHSANAEVYRRLLEETPPVTQEELRTPRGIGRAGRVQSVPTINDLADRLKNGGWNKAPPE
jgi:hypothetical protein